MTASNFIKGYLTRFPLGAALCYAAVVLVFLFMAAFAVLDLLDRRDAVAMAADTLSRLEGRGAPRPPVAGVGEATVMTGSPVLEGPTVTVAGPPEIQAVVSPEMLRLALLGKVVTVSDNVSRDSPASSVTGSACARIESSASSTTPITDHISQPPFRTPSPRR